MIRLAIVVLYNLLLFPVALLIWAFRRAGLRKRPRALKLTLHAMPDVARAPLPWGRRPTLGRLAEQIGAAARHPKVSGLFVALDGIDAGAAELSELGALLDLFKAGGKPLHVSVEPPDSASIGAAAVADRLTTGPANAVMVHGVGLGLQFAGELLDRHGVRMHAVQRKEYKGVLEPLQRREPSPALAESIEAMTESFFEQTARGLARRPRWDLSRARTALEQGPYTMAQAVERGLIDGVANADEAEDALARQTGGAPTRRRSKERTPAPRGAAPLPPLLALPPLAAAGLVPPRPLPLRRRPTIAFIPVAGVILDRPVRGFARRQSAIAAQLAPRIRALAETRGVEAIVLTIDSRGGSVTGSDQIWHAVRYALGRKPVVAWMRGYAASGGYYIASAAHHIVASPFTVTGSIGVIAFKADIGEAAARLGINPVFFGRGAGANLLNPFRPFDAHETAWLEARMDEAYERFKAIVAEGRRLAPGAVEEAAKGRVWTGPQAQERGLVDQVGSYLDVVAAARALAGLPDSRRHATLWVAPPEGVLGLARRFGSAGPGGAIADAVGPLIEPLLAAQDSPVLYYA